MIKIKNSKIDTLIEKVGLKYFLGLTSKLESEKLFKMGSIPSDKILQVISRHITVSAVIIAFLVGAITTVPTVIFEIYYKSDYHQNAYYLILVATTLLFLFIEVSILYWLSLKSVHAFSVLMNDGEQYEEILPAEYDVKKMMVRAALELSDPAVEYLGINPQKDVSKKWLVFYALLYKAKIALTGIILRIALRKIALRFGFRIGFIWIAIPVTAVWDAVVMYKVLKDAKLRLYGYYLSKYISQEIITSEILKTYSENVKEGCLRALSTLMVLSESHHPNNIMLLVRLTQNIEIEESEEYDDLEKYLLFLELVSKEEKHLLRSLSGIVAVFDGKLNKSEIKALQKIFGEEEKIYMEFIETLQQLLLSGQLHQSAFLCKNMILPK